MVVNLEPILSGLKDSILIDENVIIADDLLKNSSIKKLDNVRFLGKVKRLDDLPITLDGKLDGIMTLLDDIDLSDVDYKFSVDVDEVLETEEYKDLIEDNKLYLDNLLWQLIQVEIPSKVHGKNINDKLSGDGWKLVSEEELNKNNAFVDLDKMLEERSQK